MTIALGDILRVTVRCQASEQAGINVLHALVDAVTDVDWTMKKVATQLFSLLQPAYAPLLANTAVFARVQVANIKVGNQMQENWSTQDAEAGTGGVDILPRQAAGILTLMTGAIGSRGRGRVYVPFPSEARSITPGAPDATYVTALDALGVILSTDQTIVDGGNSLTLKFGVYHRGTKTLTPTEEFRSRFRWATQKRRGSYGRANPL